MAKEWAKDFYASTLWRLNREYALKRDRYTCRRCGRLATVVHHKIHLTRDNISNPQISLNPDNLESLCDDCHKLEHDNERKDGNVSDEQKKIRQLIQPDYKFDDNGNIIPL